MGPGVETGQEKKKLSKYVNCKHTADMWSDEKDRYGHKVGGMQGVEICFWIYGVS
jgi:hypothetical protein